MRHVLRGPLKSFIDGAADCFDNRRAAKIVPSAILLSANFFALKYIS